MAEEKRAKVQDMLLEGAIMKSYGSKYFVSITLAPEICKAKVEMVEIGSNGKNSNTVYLDIEILRQLFTELDTNVFASRINADKSNKYPQAYQYVTGENGDKKVNIGASQKAGMVAFQTQVKKEDNWDNRIMAIAMSDLLQAGFLFKLCLGLTQVDKGSYYDNLKSLFYQGLKERAKYFASKDEKKVTPQENEEIYELTTAGDCYEQGNFFIFPVVSENDNKSFKLMVRKDTKIKNFDTLKDNAGKVQYNLRILAEEKDGFLLFKKGA